jgi:NitT/TauT family transport system permease protein
MFRTLPPISVTAADHEPGRWFSVWDAVALLFVIAGMTFLGETSASMMEPLAKLQATPISLDPWALPGYAARSMARMLAALALSLTFTFTYATLAAKSRRAEMVLVPLLDILQSAPILGFISITVLFFLSLAPGRMLGAECAAVFAIFTSQAWNMAFSFYQSLRTVPVELTEAARSLRLSPWTRFWRLEVPFAMPGLIWNMMMSMSGGWFFVVASEAIVVGDTTLILPGVGSYIATAIEQRNLTAIFWAIGAMAVVIAIYDQLLFRPLVAWSDRFRAEQQTTVEAPSSWVLLVLRRSRLASALGRSVNRAGSLNFAIPHLAAPLGKIISPWRSARSAMPRGWGDRLWQVLVFVGVGWAAWSVGKYLRPEFGAADAGHVVLLALITLTRVAVLIALASLVWTPIGVMIGLRPRVARFVQPAAQLLAAFPANLFFPVAVYLVVSFHLTPDIWLSPLMILGTQWYIFFNVIAGAMAIPSEMRDVGGNLGVTGWLWWRKIALPAIYPYYLTGAITASGGSFNASIVAEYVSWGDTRLETTGIGAYIAAATAKGDFHSVVLGIVVMSAMVVLINRMFWRPLYAIGERRFRLD